MDDVRVRYIVEDVAAAIDFYTRHLGFVVDIDATPGFAALSRGALHLLVNANHGAGGAAQAMPDGRTPEPGGWNRIQFVVDDIAAEVERLRAAGLTFRSDIIGGRGGQQVLLEDTSGNPIELFQPAGGR